MRLIHLYLGVFIAPAVLFFSFSGILQTLSLHDASRDGSYTPPTWLVELAQLHKKQTLQLPERKIQADGASPEGKLVKGKKAPTATPVASQLTHNPVPMKVFFVIVGIGLISSTITGLYMATKYVRRWALLAVLLLGGIVIPVLLTMA